MRRAAVPLRAKRAACRGTAAAVPVALTVLLLSCHSRGTAPTGNVVARKIVLASCKEVERAKAVASGEKVSEARLDDLARVSDVYVSFIVSNLEGRTKRERNVIDSQAR